MSDTLRSIMTSDVSQLGSLVSSQGWMPFGYKSETVQRFLTFAYSSGLLLPLLLPFSAIPIFLLVRALTARPKSSLVIFALSIPSIVFPIKVLSAGLSWPEAEFWFLLFPAGWILPLIALYASIQLCLVVSKRTEDQAIWSLKTIMAVMILLGLYFSIVIVTEDFARDS